MSSIIEIYNSMSSITWLSLKFIELYRFFKEGGSNRGLMSARDRE